MPGAFQVFNALNGNMDMVPPEVASVLQDVRKPAISRSHMDEAFSSSLAVSSLCLCFVALLPLSLLIYKKIRTPLKVRILPLY